ncbi:MAG: hypothetical protein HQ518_21875 [Rhodopirellula sp.]|nr:hypothetical protein [Rhodopirellula sp.]
MTKKMFVRERSRSDFLIAEVGKSGFTSLNTGKSHAKALVVYTGVDLTPEHLIEKGAEHGLTFSAEDAEYTLQNVVNFKISKSVSHESRDDSAPVFEQCG